MSERIEELIEDELASSALPAYRRSFLLEELERFKQLRSSPEFLDAESQRQGQNFLRHGFHREGYDDTDQGRQAYLDSLPAFSPQPEKYRGKFDKLFLVEKRIPWEKQAQLADILISDFLRSRFNETRPWEGNRAQAPDKPYAGWFNEWGQRFPDKIRPIDARSQLGTNEVGGDPFEGVALEVHFPEETANGKYRDLIGYQVGPDRVPSLRRWDGGPGLDAYWDGRAGGRFRPLVRGSQIRT